MNGRAYVSAGDVLVSSQSFRLFVQGRAVVQEGAGKQISCVIDHPCDLGQVAYFLRLFHHLLHRFHEVIHVKHVVSDT